MRVRDLALGLVLIAMAFAVAALSGITFGGV